MLVCFGVKKLDMDSAACQLHDFGNGWIEQQERHREKVQELGIGTGAHLH